MGKSHSKGRRFEQDIGKWLLKNDGECDKFAEMTTSTGRLGQLTNLQFDVISNHYAVECKHRSSVPKWLMSAWEQIIDKSAAHDKSAMLAVKKNYKPIMHIITPERHAELLRKEKEYDKTKN